MPLTFTSQALATALFEEEDYPNKPQYKDLFLKGQECLVKGVTFMGTPFNGSGYANLFGPFIKAIRQLNDFTAVNDSFVNALNTRQPVDVTKTVNQFYSVMRQRNIRLVIGCEERPVAGSKLVRTESKIFFSCACCKPYEETPLMKGAFYRLPHTSQLGAGSEPMP